MPIAASDIKFRYSGGAGNNNPNACLGGAISTDAGGSLDDAVLHDLFDLVSSAEASAGDTEYRGIYVRNDHATLPLTTARIFFATASNDLDIALADEAMDVAMEVIANESTAPVGPTFTHPVTYATGLDLSASLTGGSPGSFRGVWIRRVIPGSAGAETAHSETITVQGDTAG